jgi:cytochrome c oxidase subunit 3
MKERNMTMDETLKDQQKRAKKPLLWIAQASMFMAFAGLMSGYLVSKGSMEEKGLWMEFSLPDQFLYSTITLAVSSILLVIGRGALRGNNQQTFLIGLLGAWALSFVFTYFQFQSWDDLIARGIFFTGPGSNVSGSWIYALSFLHFAHVIGGIIALSVTSINALLKKYHADEMLGFDLAATYWHFLGLVWLILYLFLNFVR